MEQSDLLRFVVAALQRLGVEYFVTGSIASMYFGEARLTNDIDVVVRLPPQLIDQFCVQFPTSEFYLSADAVRQAVLQHGQFNIIHPEAGLKVDVMIPSDTAFNQSRFARRRRVTPAPDYSADFASPEDVILKKMDYYREGGGEKHLRDSTGILRIGGNGIDRQYIADWAERLGLQEIWQMILGRLNQP